MIPKLQAEEALMQIQVGQVAAGLMEKNDARQFIRRLQSLAEALPEPARASIGDLVSMGITVAKQ